MDFLPRLSRLAAVLPLTALAALALTSAPACNGSLATVLSSDDGGPEASVPGPGDPDGSLPGDAAVSSCVANGGMCIGKSTPPAGYRIATAAEGTCDTGATCYVPDTAPTPGCVTDQDCNGDSAISSLMGTCFHGVCICQSPYNVGANGKCANIKLPDCQSQSGTCRQMPATCLGTEIETTTDPFACGDLIAAVCCSATAGCKGAFDGSTPVDFACCGKAGGTRPAVCLNGWKTCSDGAFAILPGAGCK